MSIDTTGLTRHPSAHAESAVGMEKALTALEREAADIERQIRALRSKKRQVLCESATLREAVPAVVADERAVVAVGGIPDSDLLRHYHDHGCAPAIFPKGDGTDRCSQDYGTPLRRVAGGWVPTEGDQS